MQAAFTGHGLPEAARHPFFLYVDEFHNLTTKTFAGMLSEARKYGLGLILAHQHMSQIDRDTRDAIIGNVGNQVVFRVGASDAPFFATQMPTFSAFDFQNQPNHRANVLLTNHGEKLTPFTASVLAPYPNR